MNQLFDQCRLNEKLILHVLRLKKHQSKAALARLTGLTAAAIGGIIKSLNDKGLVKVIGRVQGEMGQPATMYALEDEGAFGLGVSINRGHIETVLLNFTGHVVDRIKHQGILGEPETVLALALEDIKTLLARAKPTTIERIAGIGIAQPFNVSSSQRSLEQWRNWDNFDLATELNVKTGFKTVSQNDGNAGAMAELIYGSGQNNAHFIYLFFGSALVQSLGGATLINNECFAGKAGNGGDIGLIPVPPSKLIEHQGSNDEWTTLTNRCSLYTLLSYLQQHDIHATSTDEFEQAIASNKQLVNAWVEDAAEALYFAIHAIQATLEIPLLIIDCEDENKALIQLLVVKLDDKLAKIGSSCTQPPDIQLGRFGSDAAAIGAATLPLDIAYSHKK